MRRRPRVDGNQNEIVQVAEDLGCTVVSLAGVGSGCPDILIGQAHRGGRRNILVEIKADGGGLTPDQVRFHREWRGQVAIVRSVKELLDLLRR